MVFMEIIEYRLKFLIQIVFRIVTFIIWGMPVQNNKIALAIS
jgi:hypothetical protein